LEAGTQNGEDLLIREEREESPTKKPVMRRIFLIGKGVKARKSTSECDGHGCNGGIDRDIDSDRSVACEGAIGERG
jgi:hypothetical protein